MCGIVYRKSLENRNISFDVLQLYKNQRNRGSDGFGFFDPNNKKLIHKTEEKDIVRKLKNYNTTEMLYHHRYPTSTKNVQNACHPFKVTIDNVDYFVVHNGYLSNDYELKEKHEKKGFKYSSNQPDGSFNDSESLAIDLALYLSGKQRKLYSKGVVAFIVYTKDALYFGRNSNPLFCHINDKNITIRSEGKGFLIDSNTLYTLKNNKLTKRKLLIPEYEYTKTTYDYNGYYPYSDYYYQKEQIQNAINLAENRLDNAYYRNDTKEIDAEINLIEELRAELYDYYEL